MLTSVKANIKLFTRHDGKQEEWKTLGKLFCRLKEIHKYKGKDKHGLIQYNFVALKKLQRRTASEINILRRIIKYTMKNEKLGSL